jgi:hypothetical protein
MLAPKERLEVPELALGSVVGRRTGHLHIMYTNERPVGLTQGWRPSASTRVAPCSCV